MNVEHKLVLSILKAPTIARQTLLAFNPENLLTEARNHFLYIKNFYLQHHKIPEIPTFEDKFGELVFPDKPLETPDYYAFNITSNINREKLMKICARTIDLIEDPNHSPETIREFIEKHLKKIETTKAILSGNLKENTELRLEYYEDKKKNNLKRFQWGFAPHGKTCQLDIECPLVGGGIYVITARPGIGKTFAAAKTAAYLASQGVKVLFVSKELSYYELAERIDAMASGISYPKIRKGLLDSEEFDKYKQYVQTSKLNIEIASPKNCTQNTIEELIQKHNPELVIVDYIQLLKDANQADQRHLAVENIVYDLKSQAQIYQIPMILISSANRASTESKKGPDLENLSASDAIGFAVDGAFSLYQTEEQKVLNLLTFNTIKNRSGKRLKLILSYDIDNSTIEEWSSTPVDQK